MRRCCVPVVIQREATREHLYQRSTIDFGEGSSGTVACHPARGHLEEENPMNMKHKTLYVVGGLAAVAALMATSVPAQAAATPKTGVGTVKCSKFTGTLTFSPALKNGGTAAEKISISSKATGCTGTLDGASIASATTTGSLAAPTNDCQALLGTNHFTLATTTKWTVKSPKPALKPTNSKFTTESGNAGNGGTVPISFDAKGKDSSGSFVKDLANAHAVIQETVTQLATACGSTGVKTLHIKSGFISLHH